MEVRTWGWPGVSVLVCTRGAAFEIDWWNLGCFSRYCKITHFSPCLHALCVLKVDSKELECNVTTTAMAKGILCLKTLAFIPS